MSTAKFWSSIPVFSHQSKKLKYHRQVDNDKKFVTYIIYTKTDIDTKINNTEFLCLQVPVLFLNRNGDVIYCDCLEDYLSENININIIKYILTTLDNSNPPIVTKHEELRLTLNTSDKKFEFETTNNVYKLHRIISEMSADMSNKVLDLQRYLNEEEDVIMNCKDLVEAMSTDILCSNSKINTLYENYVSKLWFSVVPNPEKNTLSYHMQNKVFEIQIKK